MSPWLVITSLRCFIFAKKYLQNILASPSFPHVVLKRFNRDGGGETGIVLGMVEDFSVLKNALKHKTIGKTWEDVEKLFLAKTSE